MRDIFGLPLLIAIGLHKNEQRCPLTLRLAAPETLEMAM